MALFVKSEIDKETNIEYRYYEVSDYNYFSMIDNQVRSEYVLCEEFTLLPLVEKLYKDNGIDSDLEKLIHYPIEGYYYKTKGLTKYFQLVRNLQENPKVYKKVKPSQIVEDLKWLFGNYIWGTIASERSETIFPRMKDILTNTLNSLQLPELWKIDIIMSKIHEFATGNPNLVELAYLTGDIRCLTAGAETNSLYREMSFCASGCMSIGFIPPKIVNVYTWKVSEKVQSLGDKLIDKYNEVIIKFQKEIADSKDPKSSSIPRKGFTVFKQFSRDIPKLLVKPTEENQESMLLNQDLESPRVAMLGKLLNSPMHYHWILDNNKVTEKWAEGVITTENYMNNKGPEKFNSWDMSGVTNEDGKIKLGKLWSTKSPDFETPKIVPGVIGTKDGVVLWNNPAYDMSVND